MATTQTTTAPDGALAPYLRAIGSHLKLVIAVLVLTVGAAAAWIAVRSPDYQATAQILVSPLAQDDSSLRGVDVLRSDPSDSTRTIQTAAALIDSPVAAAATALILGPGWDANRVRSAVEVKAQGVSNVLSIVATSTSGPEAQRLANTFARQALATRDRAVRVQIDALLRRLVPTTATPGSAANPSVGQPDAQATQQIARLRALRAQGDPAFSVTQQATVPSSPIQTSAPIIVALAIIAGFALGAGAALLAELMDRSIRDEEELRQLTAMPILAHIPVVPRRQRRRMRSLAGSAPAIREAFRTLQVQLDRLGNRPRVLMVTSASSGDAKTTSALNLAVAMVGAGHRVILMDFDLRKPDIGPALGVEPRRSLVSLFEQDVRLDELLVEASQAPTLRVLPADNDRQVILLDALGRQLPKVFEQAREMADYVVVDTPPLGEISDALRLVDLVDDIVVVARPGNTDKGNFEVMRDLLERTGTEPTGLIVVGDSPGSGTSSYYTYGLQGQRRGITSLRAE